MAILPHEQAITAGSLLNFRVTNLDIAFGALALLLVVRFITRVRRLSKGLRLPPGPPAKLIVGNAWDMPTSCEWVTYDRWAKLYGDLVYIKVFGQNMLFVNSMEIARDLCEKRSRIYSDRSVFPMLMLMGWDFNLALMRYGDRWRRHRRTFHQGFHPAATATYNPIQTKQARYLLRMFHKSPEDFSRHIRHFAGAVIMEIVYGIQVLPTNDPYIETAEKAVAALAEVTPGAFLVDTFPILKYVPEWMPGAGFHKWARNCRATTLDMLAPFVVVKKAFDTGTAAPSLTASLLEKLYHRPDAPAYKEEDIRCVGAVAYTGASDTTVSALTSFMLAMVLYPDAQRKAQMELDAVMDMGRLPTFEDRRNLPYVNALCKEVFRWHPVLPFGIPHRVTQDDVYGDYFIQNGSLVFLNAWTILHDERIYGPNTEMFIPERFLKPGVEDPIAQFGFGRRVCPGRYLADNSVFIVVASILMLYEISHARDNHGKVIPVEPLWTSGFLSYPEPFQCSIKSRSAFAQNILEQPDD